MTTIDDKDLVKASYQAREEANRWRNSAFVCRKNLLLNRESYVMLLYSCELFIKCLLMLENINITKDKGIHNLKTLYEKVPNSYKNKIKELTNISELPILDHDDNLVINLNSFELFLEYISDGFMNYRYEYEKFANNEIITIPNYFIDEFNGSLYSVCKFIPYILEK